MNEYTYIGDRSTSSVYKGRTCRAIRRNDGKCIRGKNGNMLVSFENNIVVVQARLLRKIKRASEETLNYCDPVRIQT
jgi:hypothetical protein